MRYLRRLGAPVDDGLRKAKLPLQSLDDPGLYISSLAFWHFTDTMARREGIEDLGFLVGQDAGANAADPELTRTLLRPATLHHALLRFCKLASSEISRVALWLERVNDNYFRVCYQPSFGADHPAYDHFEWYGIMATIDLVRLFTGTGWQPAEIGLVSNRIPGQTIRERFPHTRFLNRQQSCVSAQRSTVLLSRV